MRHEKLTIENRECNPDLPGRQQAPHLSHCRTRAAGLVSRTRFTDASTEAIGGTMSRVAFFSILGVLTLAACSSGGSSGTTSGASGPTITISSNFTFSPDPL